MTLSDSEIDVTLATKSRDKGSRVKVASVTGRVARFALWRVPQSRDSFSEQSAAVFYATLTRVRVARQKTQV